LTVKFSAVAVLLMLTLATVAQGAAAHTPGAPPAGANGVFVLTPEGTNNSTVHDFLSAFGLPISTGDKFQFAFTVDNGSGPPVYFEIHSHGGVQGYVKYYNRTATNLNDSWVVPQDTSIMIWFANVRNVTLSVAYDFVLYAPLPDITPYLLLMAGAIGGAVAWMWWVRGGQPALGENPDTSPTPENPDPSAPPTENPPSDRPR
jgi:hypothetical protein